MGEISSQIILAELPIITQFKNAREFAAWSGLTPCHFIIGTSERATELITKIGFAHLRRALFNAGAFNPLFKEFSDRLQNLRQSLKLTVKN